MVQIIRLDSQMTYSGLTRATQKKFWKKNIFRARMVQKTFKNSSCGSKNSNNPYNFLVLRSNSAAENFEGNFLGTGVHHYIYGPLYIRIGCFPFPNFVSGIYTVRYIYGFAPQARKF